MFVHVIRELYVLAVRFNTKPRFESLLQIQESFTSITSRGRRLIKRKVESSGSNVQKKEAKTELTNEQVPLASRRRRVSLASEFLLRLAAFFLLTWVPEISLTSRGTSQLAVSGDSDSVTKRSEESGGATTGAGDERGTTEPSAQ